jgi:hypothetical protein
MVQLAAHPLAQDDIESVINRQCQLEGLDRRSEHRKFLRLTLTATLLTMPRLPQIQVLTDNLSANGIGFTSYWAFTQGDLFVIPMRLAENVEILTLCQITSSQLVAGGLYRSGAKFIDSVTTNDHVAIPEQWIEMGLKKNDE